MMEALGMRLRAADDPELEEDEVSQGDASRWPKPDSKFESNFKNKKDV